jgi:hypothetical protein
MSKAKKEAYAAQQKAAANTVSANQLIPLGLNTTAVKAEKARKGRKQSRGK